MLLAGVLEISQKCKAKKKKVLYIKTTRWIQRKLINIIFTSVSIVPDLVLDSDCWFWNMRNILGNWPNMPLLLSLCEWLSVHSKILPLWIFSWTAVLSVTFLTTLSWCYKSTSWLNVYPVVKHKGQTSRLTAKPYCWYSPIFVNFILLLFHPASWCKAAFLGFSYCRMNTVWSDAFVVP